VVLDSGDSFHITSDSSIMSSHRPLDSPLSVVTADGTPLFVSSRGTLSTSSSSYVPAISHVPRLTMNRLLPVRLLTLIIVSFSMLILVLFRIIARRLWMGLVLASMIL
jgi:hypothetical protein